MQALASQPDSVDAYVARSAAYIKLDQHLEAAEDASQALLIQPSHHKALVRRGYVPSNTYLELCLTLTISRSGHRASKDV